MKPTENRWSYLSNTAPQQPSQALNIIIIFYHILQEKTNLTLHLQGQKRHETSVIYKH
jgi:hypothetical protein